MAGYMILVQFSAVFLIFNLIIIYSGYEISL